MKLDDLMENVRQITSASNQIWSAQSNGATWEETTDDRKHYAALTCALEDKLRILLGDRTRLEYEAMMMMTAMTDVLAHFTKTPSSLKDSEARGIGHAANKRMLAVLQEIGAASDDYVPCYSKPLHELLGR